MAYSQKVIDHYENPQNVGSLDKADPQVGTGLVGAPACGDVMKLQLKINDDGIIEDAKFKTFGCGSAIASSSLAVTSGMNSASGFFFGSSVKSPFSSLMKRTSSAPNASAVKYTPASVRFIGMLP